MQGNMELLGPSEFSDTIGDNDTVTQHSIIVRAPSLSLRSSSLYFVIVYGTQTPEPLSAVWREGRGIVNFKRGMLGTL